MERKTIDFLIHEAGSLLYVADKLWWASDRGIS